MTITRYIIEAYREGCGWYEVTPVHGTIFEARAALAQLEYEHPTEAFRIADKLARKA